MLSAPLRVVLRSLHGNAPSGTRSRRRSAMFLARSVCSGRYTPVQPRTDDSDRPAADIQRRPMGCAIDTGRQSGDHGDAVGGEVAGEPCRHFKSIPTGAPGSYHGAGSLIPRLQFSSHVQNGEGTIDRCEPIRILGRFQADDSNSGLFQYSHFRIGSISGQPETICMTVDLLSRAFARSAWPVFQASERSPKPASIWRRHTGPRLSIRVKATQYLRFGTVSITRASQPHPHVIYRAQDLI